MKVTDVSTHPESLPAPLDRLIQAVNSHDLDDLVACFTADYLNETPAHPHRGFRGSEQVRRNWAQIFGAVADVHAQVPRLAVDGDTIWTEWELTGTRPDGVPFDMRGVVMFRLAGTEIAAARFYLEPVEVDDGDVNTHTKRVVGEREES
jgi:ketosteroid isomerase-like protein